MMSLLYILRSNHQLGLVHPQLLPQLQMRFLRQLQRPHRHQTRPAMAPMVTFPLPNPRLSSTLPKPLGRPSLRQTRRPARRSLRRRLSRVSRQYQSDILILSLISTCVRRLFCDSVIQSKTHPRRASPSLGIWPSS